MSSAGATVVEAMPQRYFCHQCDLTVNITSSASGDLLCSTCQPGFIEEFEPTPPSQPLIPFQDFDYAASINALFAISSPDSFFNQASNPASSPGISLDDFEAIIHVLGQMADHQDRGVNVRFEVDQGMFMPRNLGDYIVGAGLEELIQQLAENDPNGYGTPPASTRLEG